jgi:hypothetical protein
MKLPGRANIRLVLVSILLVAVLAAIGFIFWANDVSGPSVEALQAYQTDNQVTVTQEDGLATFGWAGVESSTGFVFYPGGRVDYRSYAPLLRQIAARGYFVVLTPMPLNLAFFDVGAADRVMENYPQIKHWAIGGHSLGGVAAATYAASHPAIEGVVFWASYPANGTLRDMTLRVLSIYGSNDGLASPFDIDASRALLPTDSIFIEIAGGNHSQFGSYGPQAGDNPASISAEEQWREVADATVTFLYSLSK